MSPSAPFLPTISPAEPGKEADPPPRHAGLISLLKHRDSRLLVERGTFLRPELWPESGGSIMKDLRIAQAYLQLSRDNLNNYLQTNEPERHECPWSPEERREMQKLYEQRLSSPRNYSILMHDKAVKAAEAEGKSQEAPPADEILLQEAQTGIIEVEGVEVPKKPTGQDEGGSQGGREAGTAKMQAKTPQRR